MCELLVTSFLAVFVAEILHSNHDNQEFDRRFEDVALSLVAVFEVLSSLDCS